MDDITSQQYIDNLYDRRDSLIRERNNVQARQTEALLTPEAARSDTMRAWLIRGDARITELTNMLEMIDGRIEQATDARAQRFTRRFVNAAQALLAPDIFKRIAQVAQREGGAA